MVYAPIVLFTYSRVDHTRQVVGSLLKNEEAKDSELFIFSDGPKTEEKREAVEECRKYLHTVSGFKSITIVERKKNWGLANSLIAGITEVINKYGRVIVVEDDLIVSQYFLRYMNEALEKYEDEEKVASISAFLNPVEGDIPETFFLRYFACWGWATWKRAWDLMNLDARDLLRQLCWKKNDFNIGGAGSFYEMLYCQKVGLVDSWAVRFYASCFLKDKLHLFPGKTMVAQTGTDGSGTHCTICDTTYSSILVSNSPINVSPIKNEENMAMYNLYANFYKKNAGSGNVRTVYNKLKSFVRRLFGIDYK